MLYGVLGGFGLGLIYLPAVVAVGYYFDSKRALATGFLNSDADPSQTMILSPSRNLCVWIWCWHLHLCSSGHIPSRTVSIKWNVFQKAVFENKLLLHSFDLKWIKRSNCYFPRYGWKGANIIFAGLCLQCAVKSFKFYNFEGEWPCKNISGLSNINYR